MPEINLLDSGSVANVVIGRQRRIEALLEQIREAEASGDLVRTPSVAFLLREILESQSLLLLAVGAMHAAAAQARRRVAVPQVVLPPGVRG